MAQKIGGRADVADHLGQIGGEIGIAVAGQAGAVAVVAHVDGEDITPVGQTAGDDAPVAARSEQAVRDDEGRLVGRDRGGVVDQVHHCFPLEKGPFPPPCIVPPHSSLYSATIE